MKTMTDISRFGFEELDEADAPDAETFWWGMWLGIGYVGTIAVLAT
ncbi:hypothetical protein J2Y69_001564 [Microbacterium resistens]|uniref:Uncharacterized protein n=1 Tax=Microbacterium resistens TaxID=156977 RepID=A0ABU1SBH0_9MICO|nr:hypothetical protein [Microbacterium resistens]MDR6866965.1 hypothetical protein [Microbacterium resistens]